MVPEFSNQAPFFFDRPLTDNGISITEISQRELFAAKELKMEMPLADGALPILDIRPQDSEFQKFVSRCKAIYPGPVDYGPPSLTDSYWNLTQKAQHFGNSELTAYLKRLRPDQYIGFVGPVPGTTFSQIYVPGDVLPGLLDWTNVGTQTVWVRGAFETRGELDFKYSEVEITSIALDRLKQRRDDLLALGVSATQARIEPDSPPNASGTRLHCGLYNVE
jgi:hypothetical protein